MPAISFLPFLQGIPMGTRLLAALLILTSLASFALENLARQNSPIKGPTGKDLPWLVIIPGESWMYPWTLLSAGWVELSIFELAFSVVTLVVSTRYLERIWGFTELLRFSFLVIIGSNLIALGFSWLMYFVLGSEDALRGPPYHGLSGLQIGFLVAFTQLIPEHQIQLLGALRIKVKALPGIYLLISNVVVILFGPSPYMLIQFGFFVSWVYLRFFKLSDDGLIRGDRSETFAFQYWFPPFVRPYIARVGNKVFQLAVRAKLVQAWDEPVSSGYSSLPGPGGARAEAERRRAMALKALDARIASTTAAPAQSAGAAAGPTSPSATTSTAGLPPAVSGSTAGPDIVVPENPSVPSASAAPPPPALKTQASSRSVKEGEEKSEKLKD